jgi:methylmalonyl-CoA mutase
MADSLFTEFPPQTREAWLEQVAKDLKGKSPESLKWTNEDGITLFPIVTAEDVKGKTQGMPPREYPANPWLLHHDFLLADPEKVIALVTQPDAFSLDSVGLVLGGDMRRHECSPWPFYHWSPGITAGDSASLRKLVEAVPSTVELHVTAGMGSYPAYAALQQALRETGRDLSETRGGIDNDPFRFLLKCGTLPFGEELSFHTQAAIVRHALEHLPLFRSLQVSCEPVALAGGTPAQEIATALSMAVEAITQLEKHGVSPKESISQLHFIIAVGSDFFTEIAKLRAFRRLWHRVLAGYGLTDARALHIRAKTSAFTLSHLDPHVNLLRTTTQAMSAVIGGADAVSVAEFDQVYQEDSSFSARIARNVQLLLRHESHLDAVSDAAGGSYHVEQLTAALEEKAWSLFLEWEQLGGFLAAYQGAHIQQKIWASAETKETRLLTGKEKLIGVNQFPNRNEAQAHLLSMGVAGYGGGMGQEADPKAREIAASPLTENVDRLAAYLGEGNTFARVVDSLLDDERTAVPMLPGKRASHDFEMLRRTTASHTMMEGSTPLVMLLTFGQPMMRKARAGFAANLFAIAGFGIEERDNLDEVIAEKPAVIVFCADDGSYPEHVPSLLTQCKAALPETLLVLAGKPEGSEAWMQQGLHSRIHAGMEVPSYLVNVQRKLGVL